jgi:hypothetical protein
MAKRKNLDSDLVHPAEPRIKHGICVWTGKCSDCAQGVIGESKSGFEYCDFDRDGRGFWFCRYCGSNHVTVVCDGVEIEQGNLYDDSGFPTF